MRPHHHITWLQVAVNDAVGMGIAHRMADLLENGDEPAAVGTRSLTVAARIAVTVL
jgi:desulfoferrodoxin (superoxide reductase-like protein)